MGKIIPSQGGNVDKGTSMNETNVKSNIIKCVAALQLFGIYQKQKLIYEK